MAAHYVAAITAANPSGTYALAGYSAGGVIAFEMARQLTAAGKRVTFLGMLDTYAEQSDYYDSWLRKWSRRSLRLPKQLLYNVVAFKNSPRQVVRFKIQALKRVAEKLLGPSAGAQEPISDHLKKMYEINTLALRKFRLRPQDITVHVFRSTERLYYMPDPIQLGWTEFALGGVKTHNLPGNHYYMFAPPHDVECARVLQAALDQCT
jgi:thioesterase domain-containing protein